jgi:hypothetical protein
LERGGEGVLTTIKRNQNTTSKGSEKTENEVRKSFWIGQKPSWFLRET